MIRETLSRTFGAVVFVCGIAILVAAAYAAYDTGRWGYLGAGVLALVFIGVGWSRLFPDTFAPIPVDPDDPLMKTATEHARRELPRFRRGVRENQKQAFVKFPLRTRSQEIEHIWGIVHSIDGEVATVSLANDPVDTPENTHPRSTVRMNEIEDWMLVASDGKTEGAYTTRAMAQIYKREQGFLPAAMRKEFEHFTDFDVDDL